MSDLMADTPASWCVFYRRICGLPAALEAKPFGGIAFRAGSVWAVSMPEGYGRAVRAYMQCRHYALGPIITHPPAAMWTFLIRPDLPEGDGLYAELFRYGGKVIRDGGVIALPSPTNPIGGYRQWVEAPHDNYRPSGRVVIDGLRACLPSERVVRS
jgi:hypothetical protein